MFRRLSIASMVLSLAIPMVSRADSSAGLEKLSAAEIVAKNVGARGGLQAWRSVQALSMTGQMEAGGNNRSTIPMPGKRSGPQMPAPRPAEQTLLPFVMEMKRPHKMRLELQIHGQTAIQTFDGVKGWKVRPFLGRIEPEPFTPDEMKIALLQSELDGPLVDYAAKGTRVEAEGMEKVGDKDAYKLKLTMKDGQVRHVWIDSQNFLDIKIDGVPRRMDGRIRPVEIYTRDFRSINGLMIPYLIETEVQGFQPTHKMTIQNVVVNPKLDDGLFAKPQVTAPPVSR
jgi:hypothetical protein